MHYIGESIREAIDWTQDALGAGSTRPEAEAVVFQLLAEKLIRETEDGFVLLERAAEDDDEEGGTFSAHRRLVNARFRFHRMRHVIHQENVRRRYAHHLQTLQQNDAADDMLAADDEAEDG